MPISKANLFQIFINSNSCGFICLIDVLLSISKLAIRIITEGKCHARVSEVAREVVAALDVRD